MKKIRISFQIAYLVVGALTVLEFLCIRGMFTWVMAVAGVCLLGIVNLALAMKDKDWLGALGYILCTVALCMGYFVLAA